MACCEFCKQQLGKYLKKTFVVITIMWLKLLRVKSRKLNNYINIQIKIELGTFIGIAQS
jgi:hypothetical protein